MIRTNKKWSNEENQKLLDLYGKYTLKEIMLKIPNRSAQSITSRTSKILHLKSISKTKWDKNTIQKLKLLYPDGDKQELSTIFNSKWHTIKTYAIQNNIHRSPRYHLENLMKENLSAYYWIGFLLADGCFYKGLIENKYPRYNLCLQLAPKDRNHLEKFIKFIRYKNSISVRKTKFHGITISTAGKNIITKIMKKFDIQFNKTYNPPQLNTFKNLSEDKLFSLIIGYIDGDGCVRKKKNSNNYVIQIENHKCWAEFNKHIETFLFNTFNENRKNTSMRYRKNRNTCSISITQNNLIRKIKTKIKELDLPYMKRKWNQIS